MPHRGMLSDKPEGCFHICKRYIRITRGHAVFQYAIGDPFVQEVRCPVEPFMKNRKMLIPSAGQGNHHSSCRLLFFGEIHPQRRSNHPSGSIALQVGYRIAGAQVIVRIATRNLCVIFLLRTCCCSDTAYEKQCNRKSFHFFISFFPSHRRK